jgi:2-aminoadipate transaminase
VATEVKKSKADPTQWPVVPQVRDLEASAVREILKFTSMPGVISFAGGLPAPEMFPLEDLKQIVADVIQDHAAASVQYSLSLGILPLRKLIAERTTAEGSPTTPENLMVTCGSQQGIDLLARVFINPGDYILTENPTYVGALQAFGYYQAKYCAVEMDDDGMLVDQAEEQIKKYKPKMIYSVPNFQNPTGVTMSVERRRRLVELAAEYNIPLIDDNPYSEIRFEGEAMPTLKSIGGDGVISLRTFSKTLTPGLRIGWINAAASLIPQIEKAKQGADLHTSSFGQFVVYEFLKRGLLEPQIELLRKDYRDKRDTMLKAMEEHFPSGVTWTRPTGGMFLWVNLADGMDAHQLLQEAVKLKVAYVHGWPFFPNGGGRNTLRLNFSNASHESIVTGITRLGELFKKNM